MGAILGIIGKVLGGASAAGGGGGLLSKLLGGLDMAKSLKSALATNKESTDKLPRS